MVAGMSLDRWWRDGVLYQIYPRSFADSNHDGIGDLAGITSRLDYLKNLGVSGLWLNPIHPSPNADWGYDVSDYYDIHPDLGDLNDFNKLVAQAGRRGIRIILDLVPNHTSDQHPWFLDACSRPDSRYRDFYVRADPAADGGPPNNWVSMFGGSAWTWHDATGQYYLHNFTPNQPDLNWWNENVRAEFDEILRFWLRRGVAGFRLDVCQAIVKDRLLRDNPPADETDRANVRLRGQKPMFCMNRPEVHDVLRRWRRVCDSYPHKPILLGETNTHDLQALARYYGDHASDELHMAFNFPFMSRPLEAAPLREIIEQTERVMPGHAHPVWTMSNHDAPRFVTRWCGGDDRKARAALMLLMCLRGTPMLYYGDELALGDVPICADRARDPLAKGTLPGKDGRDPCRTPMPWRDGLGVGFTAPDVEPWLPVGDAPRRSVATQNTTEDSHLRFTRDLIALRARRPELHTAPLRFLDGPVGTLTMQRGDDLVVHLNLRDDPSVLTHRSGTVLLSSDRSLDVRPLEPGVEVPPWQAVIAQVTAP